jgi:multimeric flavodoxin WrbA
MMRPWCAARVLLVAYASGSRELQIALPAAAELRRQRYDKGAIHMTVRVLGLNASPRKGSNSGILVTKSLERLAEIYDDAEFEVINLRDLDIIACADCDSCGKKKDTGEFVPCISAGKDDVQMVLDKMVEADGICIATPVYFGLPSDLFSKFVMRTRVLRHQDFRLANTPVGVMATAARRSGGAETTILATWLPLIRNGCLVVGNGDATCQFGAYGWAGGRGHILSDEWGMEQGFQTAERVYTVAKVVKAGVGALNYESPMRFSYSSGVRP